MPEISNTNKSFMKQYLSLLHIILIFLYILYHCFNSGHVPLNSYYDLLMGYHLQSEKHPTIVIALSGSRSQFAAPKRFVAFGFEVQRLIIMVSRWLLKFPNRLWDIIDVLVSFSFNSGGTWRGQGALSSAVHPPLFLPSVSQPIVQALPICTQNVKNKFL